MSDTTVSDQTTKSAQDYSKETVAGNEATATATEEANASTIDTQFRIKLADKLLQVVQSMK